MSDATKSVVITGAAGAIGSVVADRFNRAGWSLALLDYGEDNAEQLRNQFPDAQVLAADLTNADAAREVIQSVHDEQGRIDALLNIAGGFAMQPAAEASLDDLQRMWAINVQTLFNTTRATLPIMQEQEGGFVLGVSAAAADDGAGGAATYAASKAAVAGYLKSLQQELDSIRVSILYPMGVVDTPANREAMPDGDPQTWISREQLAESMLHAAQRSPRGHLREVRVFAD